MFFDALAKARQFTFPFMISRCMLDGSCTSEIGALVVLNDEGWFLTAAHLFKSAQAAQANYDETAARLSAEESIKNNTALDHKTKQKQLKKLPFLDHSKAVSRFSVWLIRDGLNVPEAFTIDELDLGLGRVEPWDKSWVAVPRQDLPDELS